MKMKSNEMDVILLFDQYLLVKQQMTTISYNYITKYTTKWKLSLAWYDVAINSTMNTCILLDKF